ncbi:MAG TPA: GDP-mannose 4,6-dehydratase [Candidatus Krumholzibacteria bacterium]|nr:GDP-mannose 4,6-dehydratase [Candidatus Krumholzibacteria bacterium]
MDKALVTGCNGFVGRALVARLAAAGYEVWGADRTAADGAFAGKECVTGDLCEDAFVEDAVGRAEPACIVHLAGQASVRQSFDDPVQTLADNTRPALNILNLLRRRGLHGRVLLVGSADEYGTVDPSQLPLVESTPANPESPYALAKAIQNHYGRMFAKLYEVDAVMTRSFNHTGPGQRDAFVLSSFARQVAGIRRGTRSATIAVGNLDVKRDFLDVRDVCDAYVVLLKKGRSGETYNVCTGQSYRIGDMLRQMCDIANVQVSIRVDSARLRPVDMPDLRGDPGKMQAHTGWSAKRPIAETLASLLEYWDKEDA